jgi:hypothetical protein
VRALALVISLAIAAAPALAHADEGGSVPDPWTAVPAVLEAPPAHEHSTTLGKAGTAAAVGAFYGTFGTWAYFAWYYHQDRNPHFLVGGDGSFGVNTYAGGADKLGHFWANMTLTRLAYQILRAGHWDPLPAKAIAFGWAAAFFFVVEVKDGYFYQFSYGDELANLLGAGLAVAFESSPTLDRLFDVRVEYWPSKEYKAILDGAAGADVNSANVAEDYSGQTYLLALHLGAIHGLGERRWTRFTRYLDGVVGYRTEHYKPDLNDPMFERGRPTQELSLGLSLNLQGVIDDVLAGHGTRRHVRAAFHALTEVFNPPFGSLRGNVATRDTDPDNVIPE